MKEQDLLLNISKTFRLVHTTPTLVTDSMVQGLSKMSIRVFEAEDVASKVPVGTDKSVDYFVIDRGLETEEAYLSKNDGKAIMDIKVTADTEVIAG